MAAPRPSDIFVLERLFDVIKSRRGVPPSESYTASLFAGGSQEIARKLGEEAVETMVAGLIEDKARLTAESADLLYHLFVLWAARGVVPGEVWAELGRREGMSGHAEKASRPVAAPVAAKKGRSGTKMAAPKKGVSGKKRQGDQKYKNGKR